MMGMMSEKEIRQLNAATARNRTIIEQREYRRSSKTLGTALALAVTLPFMFHSYISPAPSVETHRKPKHTYQATIKTNDTKQELEINGANYKIKMPESAQYKPNKREEDEFHPIYVNAGREYGVPWEVLRSIHSVETGRRDSTLIRRRKGAVGPMQFMPSTWKYFAVDGNGDGRYRIGDVHDSIHAAARYLRAHDARSDMPHALWHYNHSWRYVSDVVHIAERLGYKR